MTRVKLTFSLATVSATIPASRPSRARRGSALGGRRAEHRAERVGAGVAEHGPLAEVLGQQGERGAGGRGDGLQPRQAPGVTPLRRRRPASALLAAMSPAGERRHLDGAAGAEVEEVEQVRAARDQARR